MKLKWYVQDMVAGLQRQGLKAVIITNGHRVIQRQKLEVSGAEDFFDGLLIGGEEVVAGRAEKPAASIFLEACRLAGCQPNEVGFMSKGFGLVGTAACISGCVIVGLYHHLDVPH